MAEYLELSAEEPHHRDALLVLQNDFRKPHHAGRQTQDADVIKLRRVPRKPVVDPALISIMRKSLHQNLVKSESEIFG